jgi:hypothetical protein
MLLFVPVGLAQISFVRLELTVKFIPEVKIGSDTVSLPLANIGSNVLGTCVIKQLETFGQSTLLIVVGV